MTTKEYFALVDESARMLRLDKRSILDADLMKIIQRLGVNSEGWAETVSHFGSRFRLAAGLLSNLHRFASRLGRRWVKGTAAARVAFALAPPQLA